MTSLIGALIVMLAIKLAEGHGSLEFEARSGGIIVLTLAYLVTNWGSGALLALLIMNIDVPRDLNNALAFTLAVQFASTLVSLVLACLLVPGVHIRRFTGVVFAAALIVAIRFFAIAAIFGL